MSVVPPKDKAFLDIKLVQECMDAHAERVGVAFAEWVSFNEYILCEVPNGWIKEGESVSNVLTSKQLYNKFIESITK